MNDKKLYCVIPAAGKGTRMGKNSNKLFMNIRGIPVIVRTLKAFESLKSSGIDVHIVIVTNDENIEPMRKIISDNGFDQVKLITLGGNSRTESVGLGVKALSSLTCPPSDGDKVFIHDGARCLVDKEILLDGMDKLNGFEVCVAAVPMKNTVKQIAGPVGSQVVTGTPDRNSLVEVQTPQCFRYKVLKDSYDYASDNGIEATDDTALAELLGYKVGISKGSYSNIKIATAEDIIMAESLVEKQS